jgi:hypothetical protein
LLANTKAAATLSITTLDAECLKPRMLNVVMLRPNQAHYAECLGIIHNGTAYSGSASI